MNEPMDNDDNQPEPGEFQCPDCSGKVMWYIGSKPDYIDRLVCKKKCNGWKVLLERNRSSLSSRPKHRGE